MYVELIRKLPGNFDSFSLYTITNPPPPAPHVTVKSIYFLCDSARVRQATPTGHIARFPKLLSHKSRPHSPELFVGQLAVVVNRVQIDIGSSLFRESGEERGRRTNGWNLAMKLPVGWLGVGAGWSDPGSRKSFSMENVSKGVIGSGSFRRIQSTKIAVG